MQVSVYEMKERELLVSSRLQEKNWRFYSSCHYSSTEVSETKKARSTSLETQQSTSVYMLA